MTVADFKIQFSNLVATYDSSNWKLSYWLARGDGHTVGVAGTTSSCGSLCKRSSFTIYSPITQIIYVSAYVQKARQYVDPACSTAYTSSTITPRKYHYTSLSGIAAWIWDHGPVHYKPVSIAAGQTLTLVTEIDWNRIGMEKNFGV